MKKFFTLFKKELRELVTLQLIIPLIIMVGIFGLIGKVISSEKSKVESTTPLTLIDEDRSRLSEELREIIQKQNFEIHEIQKKNIDIALKEAKDLDAVALIIIPKNFEKDFEALKKPEIIFYTFIKSFSFSSLFGSGRLESVKTNLQEHLSDILLTRMVTAANPETLKQPIKVVDQVVMGDKKAQIGFGEVVGFMQSQTTFVPVILFLVILLAAQMVATAVATEKENKTLEILLSSPINRKAIVFSKIFASGLVALLFSVFYIVGFGSYMKSLTGLAGPSQAEGPALLKALENLGLVLQPTDYALLGLSLFASILVALAIAIILGILAEDVKGVQLVTTPLMIAILFPYIVTLFSDVSTLPTAIKYLLYLIPFSHPFLAMKYIMMHDYNPIILGIIYQFILFAIFVTIAAKIFSSDKILTFKLGLGKKKD
jgi:ABC-2 type transport system permease protein